IANPLSIILSGAMMLEYLGWKEAGNIIYQAVKSVINEGKGTPDIASGFRKMGKEATELSTSQFGDEIANKIKNL
ncbi:MAG TPA: NADP-dependent isocitrate dehydrogenase, partial [Sulfurihydrogenibium azorense]|nr:NADP-dependent isocitrate dehydrogenase [Sulfurihydrogenibium azorense]